MAMLNNQMVFQLKYSTHCIIHLHIDQEFFHRQRQQRRNETYQWCDGQRDHRAAGATGHQAPDDGVGQLRDTDHRGASAGHGISHAWWKSGWTSMKNDERNDERNGPWNLELDGFGNFKFFAHWLGRPSNFGGWNWEPWQPGHHG